MKKKSRVTAIILSIMMIFAMAPLTASALIHGYQFELEVNVTEPGASEGVIEGDILTDGCGVGVRTDLGTKANVETGDIRAGTIGLKSWTSGGKTDIKVGKITGDQYTECALGVETDGGNLGETNGVRVKANSIDVGMVREENNHRSAVDATTKGTIEDDALIRIDHGINVKTEDTGGYLSAVNAAAATGLLRVEVGKGGISMTNGEYAVKAESVNDPRTDEEDPKTKCGVYSSGSISATDTGKAGNYNYAAVHANAFGAETYLDMDELTCEGDTFVGLRVHCEEKDGKAGTVFVNKSDGLQGNISVESKDGLYGGYGLDGYVSGTLSNAEVRVGNITAPGYGVHFITEATTTADLRTYNINDAQFNVLKTAGHMDANIRHITSPNQGLQLSNTVNGKHGYMNVVADSITGGKSSAVDINAQTSAGGDGEVYLTVLGNVTSTGSDAVTLHAGGNTNDKIAYIHVKGAVSGAVNGFNGTQAAYDKTALTVWKVTCSDGNLFNLSDGSGNYDAFARTVNYMIRADNGITVTKEDGTPLDVRYDFVHEGDKLYVSADMTQCQKLVNGTGAEQEDLQQDDNGYFYIVKAGGGIEFHIADNHDYQFVEPFAWTGDAETGYTEAKAAYECRNCGATTTAPAAITEAVTKATFTKDGFTRYTATVEAADSPDGQLHSEYKDAKAIPKVSTIKLAKTSYVYTGKAIKPKVTVADANGALPAGNYSVTYAKNKNVGTATAKVTLKGAGYTGTKSLTFKITKAANPLKIKAKTATVKYSAVKKKAQTLGVTKVIQFTNKGQGAKTYAKVSGNKKITINKTTGKVTVKKGLKKGTYKVKVKVKAKGNANYKAGARTTVFKIQVK